MVCRICYDLEVSDARNEAGKQPSIWAVMAANETDWVAWRRQSRGGPLPSWRRLLRCGQTIIRIWRRTSD